MRQDWTLNLASRQAVEVWHGEARRLRGLLDVVSECVTAEYQAPLVWRDEDLSVEQWRDLDEIVAEMERQQLRDDFGKIMKGGGATGVVQGYRNDLPREMTNVLWTAGSDEWPFSAAADFYTKDLAGGHARPFADHSVDWLVRLLSASAAAVSAEEGRIYTGPLIDALIDERMEAAVGALTLAPHGIDPAALPASITAYPCPVGYPDGQILVADLERVTNDPASLVNDLLAIDDALTARR